MYDGSRMLGVIEEGSGGCLARNSVGDLLGTFESRKAAMRAISDAAGTRATAGGTSE